MPKTPFDAVKEQVEQAVVGSPVATDRDHRRPLYKRILNALAGVRPKNCSDRAEPEEILSYVLGAVLRAHDEGRRPIREGASEALRTRYWRERELLEKHIEAISFSPLIMPIPRDLIKFRKIDAVFCKHDRYGETCVWIRRQLERLHAVPSDTRTRGFLTALHIDPEHARPEEFCEPPSIPEIVAELVAESQTPPRPTRRSRGRPPGDPILDEFVATAAAILEGHGGLTREESFGFAADLVGACLGPEVNAESKMRQARRRRQRASKPKPQTSR